MIRLNVVVEGLTEQTFVRETLAPYLARKSLFLLPRQVETGRRTRRIGGKEVREVYRGGLVSYGKAKRDLQRWMKEDDSPDAHFTTMLDLYRLPMDF
ncbi:MAG: DUF4276 family protein, partial [Candidatus Sumerlaeota bacterium]|nr:DUF4276 family protein [Candidatus Sumerlaeota bacterium]